MELIVRDTEGLVDVLFGKWLIRRIQIKLITNIPKYSFRNWDNFFLSEEIVGKTKKKLTSRKLITFASQHLVCTGIPGEIRITFDNNFKIKELNNVSLKSLLKTLNYGNLSIKGQPIFTDTFNFFAENIDSYFQQYYNI